MINNKGYIGILSSFLLILVLLLASFSILYYENLILTLEKNSREEVRKLTDSQNARDKLFSCYGNPLSLPDMGSKKCQLTGVEGYEIERKSMENCIYRNHSTISDKTGDRIIYHVPVKDNKTGKVCLGELSVYI